MDKLNGGYLLHRIQPISVGIHKHTTALPGRPISQFDLRVTNLLQRSPRRVNRFILQTAKDLVALPTTCLLVPGAELVPVPAKLADEAWELMDDASKKRHRAGRAKAHQENESRVSTRRSFFDTLRTAEIMAEYPEMYFSWMADFRLRRYAVPTSGLNPQGSDFQKSIMHFARGVALGTSGLYWLCVRAANTYGHDKLPLDERFAWAMANIGRFQKIAADPTDWTAWFYRDDEVNPDGTVKEVEEPWAFLATCHELAEAFTLPDYRQFVSRLSVPLDGTANGLQHLSMAGRDPVGAKATNLTMSKERFDIYIEVSDAARKRVHHDAAKGDQCAILWYDRVDRNAVKRAVLATPYGITDEGIRRQLIEDGKAPSNDLVSAADSAAYFRDVLIDALSGTVTSAKEIMGWFQTCASRLAEAGLPMDWTTPTGSTCRQAYRSLTARRIQTLAGELVCMEEVAGGGLDASRQMLGSAPQIVHSWDASHLALTVALTADMGVQDWDMIHDSYGTHAGNTAALAAALRRTFVNMHAPNLMELLAEGWRAQAKGYHVDIPAPPIRGDFNPSEVIESPFFFS